MLQSSCASDSTFGLAKAKEVCLQAKLQQLARTLRTSRSNVTVVKSTILVVLRDMMMPVEQKLPAYQEIFLRNLRSTFDRATKPKELQSPSFDDCFQVSLLILTLILTCNCML